MESVCPYCREKLVTAEELEIDPWAGCTGVEDLRPDPYLEEVYGDEGEVWICPGRWMARKDDV